MENETKTTQGRTAGWFGTTTRPLFMHYTEDAGNSALCNKRYRSRLAPLNDGSGWGRELLSDEELAEFQAKYTFVKRCGRCVAKKEA